MDRRLAACAVAVFLIASGRAAAQPAGASPSQTESRLRDRGPGLPISMFATYIRRGELIVYPFYEYYGDHNFEYKPSEFGVPGEEDFRGHYWAHEGIVLVSYGLRENLAFEIEMAVIRATLDKSSLDASAMPARTRESGLGDVEGQLRWRWRQETERHPEVFSYAEVVVPHAAEKSLIGTAGWELAFGTGIVRGFGWGTITLRGAVQYEEASSSHFDVGEYAVEYVKRLSPSWRVYLGMEGSQDELSAITEMQWQPRTHVTVKMNLGRGLSSKATDWQPEIGVLFSFGATR